MLEVPEKSSNKPTVECRFSSDLAAASDLVSPCFSLSGIQDDTSIYSSNHGSFRFINAEDVMGSHQEESKKSKFRYGTARVTP